MQIFFILIQSFSMALYGRYTQGLPGFKSGTFLLVAGSYSFAVILEYSFSLGVGSCEFPFGVLHTELIILFALVHARR